MRMLDLFSGIGGFSLAASWVWGDELEIVAFCEIDKFCQKVLKKHWPDVPIIEDIREVTVERIQRIIADTNRNGLQKQGAEQQTGWDRQLIDLLTGGFPCQPFSCAGKRKGRADDRFLWGEMFRVIREVKPRWIIAENVSGILTLEQGMVFEQVLSDLESENYSTTVYHLGAISKNAPHKRMRVWFVAHSNQCERNRTERGSITEEEGQEVGYRKGDNTSRQPSGADELLHEDGEFGGYEQTIINSNRQRERAGLGEVQGKDEEVSKWDNDAKSEQSDSHVADTDGDNGQQDEKWGNVGKNSISKGLEGFGVELECNNIRSDRGSDWSENWLEVATRLCRVDDGVPNRVDRLKSLGNAIVPQVAMAIMQAIKNVD